MIDKRKNVLYVIHVNYWQGKYPDQEYKTKKFISQHGISTKVFKNFVKNYFKGTPNFFGFDEEYGSQRTVSNIEWQRKEVRDSVLKDITEKEKCY